MKIISLLLLASIASAQDDWALKVIFNYNNEILEKEYSLKPNGSFGDSSVSRIKYAGSEQWIENPGIYANGMYMIKDEMLNITSLKLTANKVILPPIVHDGKMYYEIDEIGYNQQISGIQLNVKRQICGSEGSNKRSGVLVSENKYKSSITIEWVKNNSK